jgi:hypothetical protein
MGEKVTILVGKPQQLVGQLIKATDGSLDAKTISLLAISIQLERIADYLARQTKPNPSPVDSN